MSGAFAAIDAWLIEQVFQPVCDAASTRLGLAAGGAACFCIDLASFGWIVSRISGVGRANPLRLSMRPHRAVIFLMLLVKVTQLHNVGLADAADLAMLLFAACALYLGACVERPPIRRERRVVSERCA